MSGALGSQRQMQLWVNHHTSELADRVMEAMPSLAARSRAIVWTSPLEDDAYREYQDAAFLEKIERSDLRSALAEFWPVGGPVWDGLAVVELTAGGQGVLLAEGKSYPNELRSGGSRAGLPNPKTGEPASPKSVANRELIERSIVAAQEWVGIAQPEVKSWMGSLYQTANRIAHLYWLREICGVEAWLCHMLFTNDVSTGATSQDEWERTLELADAELGLTGRTPDSAGHVFLPAR